MLFVALVLGLAFTGFGIATAAALISDRRRRRIDLVGDLKVARALARIEAGDRERAAGQLSAVEPTAGDVSLRSGND